MTNVVPISRATRRPVNRCSRLSFASARARLQALRPCEFGTDAYNRAFTECFSAWVAENRNVVRVEFRRGRR